VPDTPTENVIATSQESEQTLPVMADMSGHDYVTLFQKGVTRIQKRLQLMLIALLASLAIFLLVVFIKFQLAPNPKMVYADYYNTSDIPALSYRTLYSLDIRSFSQDDVYSAQSVIVFDVTTNTEIYSKNTDKKVLIASLTKLLSARVLYDVVDLNAQTTIDETIAKIGGSALELKQGETFKNSDLLQAAIIVSSNQSVFALNNPEDTVAKMNDLSRALQLSNSYFDNPAGFDDKGNNYSTAHDVVVISKLFFQNKDLKEMASTVNSKIIEVQTLKETKLVNTNDLLKLRTPFIIAGKTGTTPAAGQNLMLLAEKSGHQYLIIILNSSDRYKDAYKILDRI